MLYISRLLGKNRFGVVDTDDDTETIVTEQFLWDCVDAGLEIKGCPDIVRFASEPEYLEPYQPPETYTPAQVKLNTLFGVDIHVYKDTITHIIVNPKICKPVRIQLSKFGKRLGAVSNDAWRPHDTPVIFVFDDIVKPSSQLFGNVGKFDICDVSDIDAAQSIFERLTWSMGSKWHEYLIDNFERREIFKVLFFLGDEYSPISNSLSDDMGEKLEAVLMPKIKDVLSKDFKKAEYVFSDVDEFIKVQGFELLDYVEEISRFVSFSLGETYGIHVMRYGNYLRYFGRNSSEAWRLYSDLRWKIIHTIRG